MGKRKYELNEHFFDIIDTEEKAYWLGFLYADGYVHEKRHELKLRLAIKDEDFLIKFRNTLYPNKDKPLYYYKKDPNEKDKINSCEVAINSKNISEKLKEHGCGQAKTFNLSFPKWLNDDLTHHFIRGVFDGDGSICLTTLKSGEHKTTFSIIGYKQFISELNYIIAKNCNLNENKIIDYKGKDERIGTIAFSGCRQCIKIREYLYNDAAIFMQRKYDKFMLLGTNEWRTYDNLRKKANNKNEEAVFANCYNCNKKLRYNNRIYTKDENTYCHKCYYALFVPPRKVKHNNIIIDGDIAILKIKDNNIYIDIEDINIVNQYKWYIENGRVVSRQSKPKKCFYLNRLIMDAKDGQSVAFKDGDRFNLRKSNLEKRDHR